MPDPNAFAYLYPNPSQRTDRYRLARLEVKMAPFAHDHARVVLRGVPDIDASVWTPGTPVLLQWGRTPSQTGTFVGYILSTHRFWEEAQKNKTNVNRHMEIWAIGASMVLRNGMTGSYANQTSTLMVSDIARRFRFSVDASPSSYVWPAKNAVGTSYFSFLCDLAQADGRILAVNGTQIRFYDALELLNRPGPVPTFWEKDSGATPSIISMKTDEANMGVGPGRAKATRVLRSVDSVNGAELFALNDGPAQMLAGRYLEPLITEYPADVVTRSALAAAHAAEAFGRANRFVVRASATLNGDVRLIQMCPVVLEGLGSRDSGIWQCLSVTHRVRPQYYACDVELGRDSDYDDGSRPGTGQVKVPQAAPAPISRLVEGLWRASRAA